MDSEEFVWRPPPPCPYRLVDGELRVPADAVVATLSLLRRAGARESGLFWFGPRSAGGGTVAYVVAPRQDMRPRNYHITPEALAEAVYGLPPDWKPLAQVHSHPSSFVEHSTYDDRMTSTTRALSLVFPSYGRATDPFPSGVGVHEWQNDYWHLLDSAAVARRLVVVEGSVRVAVLR